MSPLLFVVLNWFSFCLRVALCCLLLPQASALKISGLVTKQIVASRGLDYRLG